MVSAKRINQVLDLHSSIQNPAQVQLADENLKGQVEFKDVTFRYAANSRQLSSMLALKQKLAKQWPLLGQQVLVNQLWSI